MKLLFCNVIGWHLNQHIRYVPVNPKLPAPNPQHTCLLHLKAVDWIFCERFPGLQKKTYNKYVCVIMCTYIDLSMCISIAQARTGPSNNGYQKFWDLTATKRYVCRFERYFHEVRWPGNGHENSTKRPRKKRSRPRKNTKNTKTARNGHEKSAHGHEKTRKTRKLKTKNP